jgi:hypothetical protein
LGKFDHFKTNKQRNADEIHHDEEPFSEVLKCQTEDISKRWFVILFLILVLSISAPKL